MARISVTKKDKKPCNHLDSKCNHLVTFRAKNQKKSIEWLVFQ